MSTALRQGRITESFEKFHADNPHVYERLRSLALELVEKGHDHYSIKGLFEVLRWEYALTTRGSNFKLNNNYTALYARMLMDNEPILASFFRVRSSPNFQVVE